jgi:hypothetical protein
MQRGERGDAEQHQAGHHAQRVGDRPDQTGQGRSAEDRDGGVHPVDRGDPQRRRGADPPGRAGGEDDQERADRTDRHRDGQTGHETGDDHLEHPRILADPAGRGQRITVGACA